MFFSSSKSLRINCSVLQFCTLSSIWKYYYTKQYKCLYFARPTQICFADNVPTFNFRDVLTRSFPQVFDYAQLKQEKKKDWTSLLKSTKHQENIFQSLFKFTTKTFCLRLGEKIFVCFKVKIISAALHFNNHIIYFSTNLTLLCLKANNCKLNNSKIISRSASYNGPAGRFNMPLLMKKHYTYSCLGKSSNSC